MEGALDYIIGVNGQLLLYEDRVVIKRDGLLSKVSVGFFKGNKTLYLNQISGIQVRPAGFLTNGYIQFTVPGGNESTKGILDATKDENTVTFSRVDNPEVERIKAKIEELQRSMRDGGNTVVQSAPSAADEIKKFKELLDQGIINENEYEAKKKQLLGI